MQMAPLSLSNSSSAAEEHHQTGYLPLPSEWENGKSCRYLEEGEIFVFLDGQKKMVGIGVGVEYLT